jgi:hypothetical protein
MATKKLLLDSPLYGLSSSYVMVIREADGYYLNGAGAFVAVLPTLPVLTEDATIKGRYSYSSASVWADGRYTVRFYQQLGGAQAVAIDPLIGAGELEIKSDAEVNAAAVIADNLDAKVSSIAIAGSAIAYTPTTATRVIGDNDGGVPADLNAHDEVYFSTGEVVGSGLEVIVERTASPIGEIPSVARITGYYNGSPTHSVNIQAYNFILGQYETKGIMINRNTPFDYTVPLSTDNQDGSGMMRLRFLHNPITYNASHSLRLDYVSFEKVATNNALSSDVAAIKIKTDQLNFTLSEVNGVLGIAYDAAKTAASQGSMDAAFADVTARISAIQNNTRFVGVIPAVMLKPESGSTTYKWYALLFDTQGSPQDPDAGSMTLRVEQTDGTILVPSSPMTRLGLGEFSYDFAVLSTDVLQPLVVFITYAENGVTFEQPRTTEISSAAGDVSAEIAAIKAQTDKLRYTTANEVIAKVDIIEGKGT